MRVGELAGAVCQLGLAPLDGFTCAGDLGGCRFAVLVERHLGGFELGGGVVELLTGGGDLLLLGGEVCELRLELRDGLRDALVDLLGHAFGLRGPGLLFGCVFGLV